MGWKTYTGAAMVGLPGALQLFATVMGAAHGEPLDMAGLQSGASMIGAALAVAGLGHKTDKGTANIVRSLGQAAQVLAAAGDGAKVVDKTTRR